MAVIGIAKSKPVTGSFDLSSPEGLEALARAQGLEPPKKKRITSTLRRLAGVLSVGSAFTSGLASGALDRNRSAIGTGFRQAGQALSGGEIKGFSDVIRQTGVVPESRTGKLIVGGLGLAGDILFDPLTYLTVGVGSGLKVGAQTLSKGGSKTLQEVATKAAGKAAPGFASEKATRTAFKLFEQATGKKGLTSEAAEQFIRQGIDAADVDLARQLGPTIVDRGGIKFAGKTLVSSDTLARTPVGRAARRLGETEVVKTLGQTLGKLFVADFGKNQKLVDVLDSANRARRLAADQIIKENSALFKGLSDDQMRLFFREVFDRKKDIVRATTAKGATRGARQMAKAVQKTEVLQFADPKLQSIADIMFEGVKKTTKDGKTITTKPLVKRFSEIAGIPEEEAIKFYIPSKFEDKLSVKEFSLGGPVSAPQKGFTKKFKGVENEQLIRDPFKAFTRGQIETANARIKTTAINKVAREFGRPLTEFTAAEAKKLGFKKFSRDTLGKKVSVWMPESVFDDLQKFIEPKADLIDELARVSGFDWATGLFKGYVTSLFPAFHMRNITSNQFLNMLKIGVDVANPKLQANAMALVLGKNLNKKLVTKTGKEISLKEIREQIIKQSDILDEGAFGKTEQLIAEAGEKIKRKGTAKSFAAALNPLSRENAAIGLGRKFGTGAEQQAKLVNVLSAVMSGKSVKQGVKQAEEALFNYSKLTPFERTVMRRLIPFYTFARKNAELQLRTMMTNPGRIAGQLKLFKNIDAAVGDPLTQEDIEGLPDFILRGVGIKAGTDEFGRPRFISGFGLPIEEFLERFSGDNSIISNAISDTLSRTNPILKFPTERATGRDFFRERPITEITNAETLRSWLEAMPDPVEKEVKEMIQWSEQENVPVFANGKVVGTKTKYTANPFVLHFMRNMFTSRIQGTVGFLTDEEEKTFDKLVRTFTGVKGWSIDQETQKYFTDRDRMKELEDYLMRMGVVKKFEKTFIPSN